MGDDNSSKSWWNTLPGKITATTTLITALAGLIAAIQQTGFITAIQQSGFTSLLSKTTQSNPQCERTPREAVLSEGTGFSECKCCPEMVVLPNGSAISKYEISKGEYAAYLADKADKNPNNDSRCYAPRLLGATVSFEPDDSFNWRNPGFSQNDNEPVVCVSWYDAKAYADWLSTKTKAIYGIPTKEEILYATDANTSSKVFWKNSETACEYANINDIKSHAINKFNWDYARCDDGYPQTNTKIPRQTAGQMEKSFKPNRLGVFSMASTLSATSLSASVRRRAAALPEGPIRIIKTRLSANALRMDKLIRPPQEFGDWLPTTVSRHQPNERRNSFVPLQTPANHCALSCEPCRGCGNSFPLPHRTSSRIA